MEFEGVTEFKPEPLARNPADREMQNILHRSVVDSAREKAVQQAREAQRQQEVAAKLHIWQQDVARATTPEEKKRLMDQLRTMNGGAQ